jgi:hypothetical protein
MELISEAKKLSANCGIYLSDVILILLVDGI